MMGLEVVIEEILSQGRAEADQVLQKARAERERILQDAQAEGAKLLARREREAKEAAERLRVQALARAELESKKIVLSAQKELLDEVYAKVLDRLGRMEESRDWLAALLRANAEEWRKGKVYSNARDAENVRSIVGANFAGTIDCVGGVIIESADGSHRTDLRFETLLADVWRDSIRDVAEALWPAH
jgi:V/A-type H+/Na+-transporting ATPase subunit E